MVDFKLKKPCSNCPFRTDVEPYLNRSRAKHICAALERGTFSCHKTVKYSDDYEEGYAPSEGEQFCAGALAMMKKSESWGQMARIAIKLRILDPNLIDGDAPVFESYKAFIDAQPKSRREKK